MAQDVAALLGGVAGVAGVTGAATLGIAAARRPRPYLPAGHAVVDERYGDPLPEVLRRGLAGLTVPVRPGPNGELFLGAGDPKPGRTLRRLVLSPLFARARARGGRLCRDQRAPFRLVVEVAGPTRDAVALLRAYRMLDQQLRDHAPLLSRCLDGQIEPGAVTVSVTGIVDVRQLLAGETDRYAFADGSFDDIGNPAAPPELVPMLSESWTRRFGWDGCEVMPAEERHHLHGLVAAAHEDDRTVRMGGVPGATKAARRAIWQELLAAGVDVIADADLSGLARQLRRHPVRQDAPPPLTRSAQPA
ncbi:phosphatidylinositol-specific phospholipase C/glycerophosphodiester phosphodiesterase family protein [Winogradskya consettensis]|uniref:Uncharacterized protein n=1 Tax=Winogradskya consettensis TaxID=113560 RepID=A0A919VV77_9ACTN|nr:hypothetical protein [Actinoplanes consettensis]GIM77981.1 hypothetical protein Aco04nite_58060 [Actinoplanes consettensis]